MFQIKRWQQLAGILKEQVEPAESENEVKEASSERKIISYYETWSPEDVEIGETDNRGELGEWSVELEDYDIEEGLTHADVAAKYLLDRGAIEPSSSHFHPGVWYSTYADEDFRTGERTVESYHLKGFTKDEEREVWEKVTSK